MSISDKIQALEASRQAIATAITQKGGTVAQGDGFSQFATEISNLPSGGSGNPLLESIDVSDFSGTTFNSATSYITGVTIPSGVTSIGINALLGCSTLRNIVIPNTVTSIKTSAFRDCTSLSSITIPNSVTSIESGAFQNCGITNVTIPYNVSSLGTAIFLDCRNLTSATLPDSLTTINALMFQNCTSLSSITIPNSVTSIDSGAFFSCSRLNYIRIPSSVTNIGHNSLSGCTSLTYIMVSATTPPTLGSNTTLNNTNDCPIYVPSESLDTYKAAANWSTYASRIYPIQQVATVDGNPVYNYDLGMTSTDSITSENMAKMPAGASVEFAEGLTNIAAGEINYQEVILPSTFTGFGDSDMIGSSVTTITSNAVTPPSAFRNQLGGSGLTAIYVPASAVDTYKAHAVWGTFSSIIQAIPVQSKLTITFEDDSTYAVPSDGSTTLNNDDLLNAITDSGSSEPIVKIEVGDMITELEDIYFEEDDYTSGTFENTSFSELVLPASLTAMGENTFAGGGPGGNGSSITCYAVTPPTFTGQLPGTPRLHPTVYVPAESVEAYQTAWSKYASWIQAIPSE